MSKQVVIIGIKDSGKSLLMRQFRHYCSENDEDSVYMKAPVVPTIGCDTALLSWKDNDISFREVGSVLQLRWQKWVSSADIVLYVIDASSWRKESNSMESSFMGLVDLIQSLNNNDDTTAKQVQVFILFNKFDSDIGGIGNVTVNKNMNQEEGVGDDEVEHSRNDDRIGNEEHMELIMTETLQGILQHYDFDHLIQQRTDKCTVSMMCISAATGLNVGSEEGLLDRISMSI